MGDVSWNVYPTWVQEGPPLIHAWAECVVRSPGIGGIVQNLILITQNAFCPTATGDTPIRMEWNMHIRATGAYARLSVVVIQGIC